MWKLLGGVGAAAFAVIVFLWTSLNGANAKLDTEHRLLVAERERAATLVDAMAALSASNTRVSDRANQSTRTILEIRHEPVTSGCGPSVQRAVDSLRH